MSAKDELRSVENSALDNNQILVKVSGKKTQKKAGIGHLKNLGAAGFITALIVVFVVLFSSGNLIPTAISERLIEETDVQYADAVESKKIVFQQALLNGELPDDTVSILKTNNVLVGYEQDGSFIESNKGDHPLSLKVGDKIVSADDFIREVSSDVVLYNAFTEATYARAAYYYDESANAVFRRLGASRDNYKSDSDFNEVMSEIMGEGSNIIINGVQEENEATNDSETGLKTLGTDIDSNSDASGFVAEVKGKNPASSIERATMDSADSLKVADTISKEQRSSLFYLGFMENISKMKAGEGNESKVNEAMDYLYKETESEIVDVNTGEVIKKTGSAVESPSLYAILAGEKVDAKKVENYSSDRILKTVENRMSGANGWESIISTVSSTSNGVKGTIGRLITGGDIVASDSLDTVIPTVNSSLVENSYETINGINAGEFLVEGAINVGKELAKASGGAAGDESAVTRYARLNSEVLAMDAATDRLNRSPFDITSRNTFLGSIIYDMAITLKYSDNTLLSNSTSLLGVVGQSINGVLSVAHADEAEGYLTTIGDCETYGTIGAVGSAQCAEIVTFDTSTLDDPYNNEEFMAFVESNTTLGSNGTRSINSDSVLAEYIIYNNERITPIGVLDGGILNSLNNNGSSIPFVSSVVELIQSWFGVSEDEKRIATGEKFINSSLNPDWQSTYKYAQRYISLARATATLRQYANDKTAYSHIKYFEGEQNPVVAFLNTYYAKVSK